MTQSITNSKSTAYAITPASTTPANGYYTMGSYVPTANLPLNIQVEVASSCGSITPTVSTGTFVFAKISLDGTNYSTGPESSNVVTDETQLYVLGFIPHTTASQTVSKSFDWVSQIGFIPKKFKIICKNVTGAALTNLVINAYEDTGLIT